MNEQVYYIFKLLAISGFMYSGYVLLLSRNQMFTLVRWYLLACLVLPLVLPLLSLPGATEYKHLPVVLIPVTYTAEAESTTVTSTSSLLETIQAMHLYVGICLIFLFILAYRILRITHVISQSKTFIFYKLRLHFTSATLSPFSFFNNILIPDHYQKSGRLRAVITHESAHIRQGHSFDNLFTEFICILQWFNPFVWLIRRAIHENHEYLADHEAMKKNCNLANYKVLLLESLTGLRIPVVNNFNQSTIKKRIIMLSKQSSGRGGFYKTLAIVVFLTLTAFLATIMVQKKSYAAEVSKLLPVLQDQKTDTPPEYATGSTEMSKFLVSNIKYPQSALKTGKTGTVYLNFTVLEDGTLSDIKVKKGFDTECDAEAVRVAKLMPKWKPGVKDGKPVAETVVLPVKFELDKGEKTKPETKKKYVSEMAYKEPKPDKEVFTVVEQMPEFPGGKDALAKFLASNVKYPADAKKAGVQGTVYVTFVVQASGEISNVKVLRGIGSGCDEAAMDAVKAMPDWKPGKQKGQPVSVQYNIPIKFLLD